ncbi:hypothetical protein F5050DRAFT_1792611 [Lentinula boryana]|uniref:Uncharacterized protein n=1 Tax=Lentinula boryana TaxID=40481 RepID=A0ABQ8PZ58_9AGAR|nr:hypothetical protein F5050DRAFT_1792611 [Lentinula boryana]
MQFCLFGERLNLKGYFVFILGLVSITYITALPVTGSKKVDSVPAPDLIRNGRSNEWRAEITFPDQSSGFLPPSFTSSFKTDIQQAVKSNVLPGITVIFYFALFESIPSFNHDGKIPFDIVWKCKKDIFTSKGDITQVKSDDLEHFRIEVNLHPSEVPGILVNSQQPYVSESSYVCPPANNSHPIFPSQVGVIGPPSRVGVIGPPKST